MRIVIDMQGAQTGGRFHGIGRYTMSFAQAVVRNIGADEVFLALSGLFPDTIEPIRSAFDGLLPQEHIRVWHAPGPVAESHSGTDTRREIAELLREAFLASLRPDIIHISSLFEGYIDDAVTSIGRLDTRTPVSVALYDLIPPLCREHDPTSNALYGQYCLRKLKHLKQASRLLVVSEFTKHEWRAHLGDKSPQITNVSTGIGPQFRTNAVDEYCAAQLRAKFGLTRPFVLYTGGLDERKNLPRLIQAYAALPTTLRQDHQLVLAGEMPEGEMEKYCHLAQSGNLSSDELCLTGYVSDKELVQLYNLCQVYVFPSWHEGFGLRALEAMACGALVIGAKTSNLREVIGLDAAVFDPLDVEAITAKIQQALTDEHFRAELRVHGLQQRKRFSWDETAKRAIAAWLTLERGQSTCSVMKYRTQKPTLAFVSPLPPERTGIADYSAELLPALSEFYQIEVIVSQDQVDVPSVQGYATVRTTEWLRAHRNEVDRVLYQIGNSPFHSHMLPLLREIPGTVVLHDFYLSGLKAWLELFAGHGNVWTQALYETHGYRAVRSRYKKAEAAERDYPVNQDVLQHALGIIVHSSYSKELARQWYGNDIGADWQVIPLLRTAVSLADKASARAHLGLAVGDFVVCSFGFLGATKLNHRLLECWLASSLAKDRTCHLIFVGQNHRADYGAELVRSIRESGIGSRVIITGFAEPERYRHYLIAADMAVQLRSQSRGETSAAVLDCMNYALPVIVNANGPMDELDQEAVWLLPDDFQDWMLVEALETLWQEPKRRRESGDRARRIIREKHNPQLCATQYAGAIERFHHQSYLTTPALVSAVTELCDELLPDAELKRVAAAIACTLPQISAARRLYLDITATCRRDLKTGIERVARALLVGLLENPPVGYRVEPVYLDSVGGKWVHRQASSYTLSLLKCPPDALADEVVEPNNGDALLCLDLSGGALVQAQRSGLFSRYRTLGVAVYSIVFDLLPVRMPDLFPVGADLLHREWLKSILGFDGAICISRAVADDLAKWWSEEGIDDKNCRPYHISWFHLGADVVNSAPSLGFPNDAGKTLAQIRARPTFLMVGTIEPRKGYLRTLEAFTQLWEGNINVNLVIVGKEGWRGLPDGCRRDIPRTVQRLKIHPEHNQRLFWLDGISDQYLGKVYAGSTCLIAASYGEGFGLPLIEAAQHKLPILARDIPVFREVAGEHAHYFSVETANELAQEITDWLASYQLDKHPKSDKMPWMTWKESAAIIVNNLKLEGGDGGFWGRFSEK